MPRHDHRTCEELCCRAHDGIATPYRVLYEREQRTSADLRRQLDTLWHRFNAAGTMLSDAGIEHELEDHVAALAKIRHDDAAKIQRLETFRLDMLAHVHDIEDGKLDIDRLPALISRANERAKKA